MIPARRSALPWVIVATTGASHTHSHQGRICDKDKTYRTSTDGSLANTLHNVSNSIMNKFESIASERLLETLGRAPKNTVDSGANRLVNELRMVQTGCTIRLSATEAPPVELVT
ncbi:hypothetical protein BDV34DRAFT_62773 [Aspergillus parasiticus]|uniref:Uncharacterized protein n=1 Tax=Aspergillus parasiticus TaxID=5067 RepID=A0A5N6E373_ASPPA|nr:hypothetical protein BDV34DRAFT_62773 [Aspergillus parasiticus]